MMADVGENSNKAALSGLLCRWVGGALRPAAGGIHPPPLLPVFVHHPPSSPPSPPSSLSTSQAFTLPAGHQEPQTFRSPIDSDTTGRTTVSVSISYCLIFCLTCGKGTKFSLNLGLKVLTNFRLQSTFKRKRVGEADYTPPTSWWRLIPCNLYSSGDDVDDDEKKDRDAKEPDTSC